MQKKREEKTNAMQAELSDLQHLEQAKQDGTLDLANFKEELSHRNINSIEEFQKKINSLMVKLNIKQDQPDEDLKEQKYNLLSIADAFLTPEQLKQKRVQKMQKTAALIREEKRKAVNLAKDKLESLKNSSNKNQYLLGLYQKRLELLDKIQERTKKKEDFSKRGTAQA